MDQEHLQPSPSSSSLPPKRPLRKRKSVITNQIKCTNKNKLKINRKNDNELIEPDLSMVIQLSSSSRTTENNLNNDEIVDESLKNFTITSNRTSDNLDATTVMNDNNPIVNKITPSVSTNTPTMTNKQNQTINTPFSAIDMELDYDEELIDDEDDSLEIQASDDLIDFVEHDIIRPALSKKNNKIYQRIEQVKNKEIPPVGESFISKNVIINCNDCSTEMQPLKVSKLSSPLQPPPSLPLSQPFVQTPAQIDLTDDVPMDIIESIETTTINKKLSTELPLPIKKRSMVNLLFGLSTTSSSSSLSEGENTNIEILTNQKLPPIPQLAPKMIASKVLTFNGKRCRSSSGGDGNTSSTSCCGGVGSSGSTSSCSGCSNCSSKKSSSESQQPQSEPNNNNEDLIIPFSEINDLVKYAMAEIFSTDEEKELLNNLTPQLPNSTVIIPSIQSSVPLSMPLISSSPIPIDFLSSATSPARSISSTSTITTTTTTTAAAAATVTTKIKKQTIEKEETNKIGLKLAASILPKCFVKLTRLNVERIKSINQSLNKSSRKQNKIKKPKINGKINVNKKNETIIKKLISIDSKLSKNNKKKKNTPKNFKRILSEILSSSGEDDNNDDEDNSLKSSNKKTKKFLSQNQKKKLPKNKKTVDKKLSKLTDKSSGNGEGGGSVGTGCTSGGGTDIARVSGKPNVNIMLEKHAIKLKMKRLKKNSWQSSILPTTISSSMSLSSPTENQLIDVAKVSTENVKIDIANNIGHNNFETNDDSDLLIPSDIDEETSVIQFLSYINDDTIMEFPQTLANDDNMVVSNSTILDLSLANITAPLDLSIKLPNNQQNDDLDEPLDLSIRPKGNNNNNNKNSGNIISTTTVTNLTPYTITNSHLYGSYCGGGGGGSSGSGSGGSNSTLQSVSSIQSISGLQFPNVYDNSWNILTNNNIDCALNKTKQLNILDNIVGDSGGGRAAGTSLPTEDSDKADYTNCQPKKFLSQRQEFVYRPSLDENKNLLTINENKQQNFVDTVTGGGDGGDGGNAGSGSSNDDVGANCIVDSSRVTTSAGDNNNNNNVDKDFGGNDSIRTDGIDELSDDAISLYAPSLGCTTPRDIQINSSEYIGENSASVSTVIKQQCVNQSQSYKIPKKPKIIVTNNFSGLSNGPSSSSASSSLSFPSSLITNSININQPNKFPSYKIPNIYTQKLTTTAAGSNDGIMSSDSNEFRNLLIQIFGKPCFKFLNNKCNNSACFYEHSLPAPELVRTKLLDKSSDIIRNVYRTFILRNKLAFIQYFQLFAELFGVNRQKPMLLSMIRDCESFTGNIMWYLKFVYTGLIDAGLSQIDAAKEIISGHTNKSNDTIDVIVDIIVDSNILYFADMLEIFYQQNDYQFKASAIKKLIDFTISTKNKRIIEILLKILDKSGRDVLQKLEQELSKFVLLLKSVNMLPSSFA